MAFNKHSPTMAFCIVGAETQVGIALAALCAEREIPYTAYSYAQWLSASATIQERFVVNALLEETLTVNAEYVDAQLEACEKIAAFCQVHDKVLLHVSNAVVFSGDSKNAYEESDSVNPQSEAGRLFLDCEQVVTQRCAHSVILRTSWLFSNLGDNFLTRLARATLEKREMRFSGALKACPTDVASIAKVLVAMAEQIDCGAEPELWGVYHYADSDACTMFTFAKTAITVIKSLEEVKIETVSEYPRLGDVRTENYELNCRKLLSTFGIKQKPWRRGLHDVLSQRFATQPEQ